MLIRRSGNSYRCGVSFCNGFFNSTAEKAAITHFIMSVGRKAAAPVTSAEPKSIPVNIERTTTPGKSTIIIPKTTDIIIYRIKAVFFFSEALGKLFVIILSKKNLIIEIKNGAQIIPIRYPPVGENRLEYRVRNPAQTGKPVNPNNV